MSKHKSAFCCPSDYQNVSSVRSPLPRIADRNGGLQSNDVTYSMNAPARTHPYYFHFYCKLNTGIRVACLTVSPLAKAVAVQGNPFARCYFNIAVKDITKK